MNRELVFPGDSQTSKIVKHMSFAARKVYVYERRPYRKPTQVDEERILRLAGEGLLRNSAN